MKAVKIISLLLFSIANINGYCQSDTISIKINNIIKEYEAFNAIKKNCKIILFNNLPEYAGADSSDKGDYGVLVFSRRTYLLDNNNLMYISNERDGNSIYPYRSITKMKEEFYFKNGKLIFYREIFFNKIPYGSSPFSDSLVNLDYVDKYQFKDEKINIEETSYFFENEKCIGIKRKNINGPLNKHEQFLKDTPENKIDNLILEHKYLLGKTIINEVKDLIKYFQVNKK